MKANGVIAFVRDMRILELYRKYKVGKEKYEVVIDRIVGDLKQEFPNIGLSITEVKRVLANYQPRAISDGFLVDQVAEKNWPITNSTAESSGRILRILRVTIGTIPRARANSIRTNCRSFVDQLF